MIIHIKKNYYRTFKTDQIYQKRVPEKVLVRFLNSFFKSLGNYN